MWGDIREASGLLGQPDDWAGCEKSISIVLNPPWSSLIKLLPKFFSTVQHMVRDQTRVLDI